QADPIEALRAVVGQDGVDVVVDFVGADQTLALARAAVRRGGSISIVGGGGGGLAMGQTLVPYGVRASTPFWGTIGDLRAVIDLARTGHVVVRTRTYGLDDVVEAYRDLEEGRVPGRAVVVP